MAPILIVETEANGESLSTNERGVLLPWLIRWALRAVKKYFYPDLAALVSPVQIIFFLTAHNFNLIVSIAQQPGQASRARSPVCLYYKRL